MLTRGVSAEVQIALRGPQVGGVVSTVRGIPLEPFASNKDMGRILIRRGGETIAAGVLNLKISSPMFLMCSRCRDGDQHVDELEGYKLKVECSCCSRCKTAWLLYKKRRPIQNEVKT